MSCGPDHAPGGYLLSCYYRTRDFISIIKLGITQSNRHAAHSFMCPGVDGVRDCIVTYYYEFRNN